jgi:hypothetical protein
MKILSSTSETVATNHKYTCEFCNREFVRESTILKHICEQKQRWLNKDLQGNRIGFQAFVEFYKKNSASKKAKTPQEFIKSPYYLAFVKFGNYCVEINALNIARYSEWLVKNQISIDSWCSDKNYTKYLIEYLKTEDPLDAIHRGVETTLEFAEKESIQGKDYLRYGNSNKICHAITTGKISPWMIFQSRSGIEFMEKLDPTQVKMVIDYIDPEQWALKFHREPEHVRTVKEILTHGGY